MSGMAKPAEDFWLAGSNEKTLNAYRLRAQNYVERTTPEISGAARVFLDDACRGLPRDARCLEIGAAFGRDAEFLRAKGFAVECVDAVEAFVEILRAKNFDAKLFNLLTDQFSRQYDLIYANAVLLHFTVDEFALALAKCRRALEPGGRFAFSLKAGEGEIWSDAKLDAPRFFRLWRGDQLPQFLRSAGFGDWDIVEAHTERAHADWIYAIARAPA